MQRHSIRTLLSVVGALSITLLVSAQQRSPAGTLVVGQDSAVLVIDYVRPLESVAYTFRRDFGLSVTYEEAPIVHSSDMRRVEGSLPESMAFKNPRGGRMELTFAIDSATKRPISVSTAIKDAVTSYNQKGFPGHYQLIRVNDFYHIVPTSYKGVNGVEQPYQSPLDYEISIQSSGRKPQDILDEMLDLLGAECGYKLHLGMSPFINGDQPTIERNFTKMSGRAILRNLIEAKAKPLSWFLMFDIRSQSYYLSIL